LPLTGEAFSSFSDDNIGRDTRFTVFGVGVKEDADILRLDGRKAAITLPETLPQDEVYMMWPGNAQGYGKPVMINKAEAWWVGPDKVAAGETFSVYGANLVADRDNPVSYIYIEGHGWLNSTSANPYKADFVMPSDTGNGDYTVWAHNGKGGEYGWGDDSLEMSVVDAIEWTGNDITVTTMTGAAIQAELNSVGDWGTVRLVAGTYNTNSIIEVPSNRRLIGAGMDNTFIKDNGGINSVIGFIDLKDESNIEIKDLTLQHGISHRSHTIRFEASSDILVEGVRFDQRDIGAESFGTSSSLRMERVNSITFKDMEFIIAGNVRPAYSNQVFFENCDFYALKDANEVFKAVGSRDIGVTESTVQHYNTSNPDSSFGWGQGRWILIDRVTYNFYFADNEAIDFGGPRSCDYYWSNNQRYCHANDELLPNQGSGETFMTETAEMYFKGTLIDISPQVITLTHAPENIYPGCVVTVIDGKGFGQHRIVESNNSNTITLKEPWEVIPDENSVVVMGEGSYQLAIYNNFFDGDLRTAKGINDDYYSNTASAGVQPYSAVTNIYVDSNNISEVEKAIYNTGFIDDSASDDAPSPNYFNIFINNYITDSETGIMSIAHGDNNGVPSGDYQTAIYGNVFRNNFIKDVFSQGIQPASSSTMEGVAHGLDVYDSNRVESGGEKGISDYRDYVRNQMFVNNIFIASGASQGYLMAQGHFPSMIGNSWSGFTSIYVGNLAPKLEVPKRVIEVSGDSGTIEILNAGTSSLSWTASESSSWLTLGSTPNINPEGSHSLAITIDESGLTEGDEAVVTISGNGKTQKVTVVYVGGGIDLTCSALGGEICSGENYCDGSNMTESTDANCCDGTCKTVPTWSSCGECGTGLFNLCDEAECEAIIVGCVFTDLPLVWWGSCDSPVIQTTNLILPEPTIQNTGLSESPYSSELVYEFSDASLNIGSPEISAWNEVAKADESITLLGTKFTLRTGDLAGTDTQVYVGTFVGDNLITYQAKIWSVFEDKMIITIPEELPEYDVFYLWIKNADGVSKPVKINSPNVLWTGPMDNVYDSTKETIRVFGKELVKDRAKGIDKTNVYLKSVSGTGDYELNVLKANPYDIEASLTGVVEGEYDLYVHKGEGAQYGWSNGERIVIDNDQFNWDNLPTIILSPSGDDDTNQTNDALNTFYEGGTNPLGGTIVFEEGIYTIRDQITLKGNTRLVGAGKDKTILSFEMPLSSQKDALIMVWEDNYSLEDLTIYFKSGSVKFGSLKANYQSGFLIKNVNFSANDNLIKLVNGYGAIAQGYIFGSSNGEVVNSSFDRQMGFNERVWFHNNTISGEPYLGRERGMEGAFSGGLSFAVIENNLFNNSEFDGDSWMFYQGDVTSATDNTVNFVQSDHSWQVSSLNELEIVPGKTYILVYLEGDSYNSAQYRKISSFTSDSITIEGTWDSIPTTGYIVEVQPSIGRSKIIRRILSLGSIFSNSEKIFLGYNKGIGIAPLPGKPAEWDQSKSTAENKGELVLFHGGRATALGQVVSHNDLTTEILGDGTIQGRVFEDTYADTLQDPFYHVFSQGQFVSGKMEAFIIAGRGQGQTRIINSVTDYSFTVNEPWLVNPDSTSVIRFGYIFADNIIYENNFSSYLEGRENTFENTNQFISLDGQSSFNYIEGNKANYTASCNFLGGEGTGHTWFNEFRNNGCYNLIGAGFKRKFWTEGSLDLKSSVDLISPILVGNTERGSILQFSGPMNFKYDGKFNSKIFNGQINGGGLGTNRDDGLEIYAPTLLQFGNIYERVKTLGGAKGIALKTYATDLYRNNEIEVDLSVPYVNLPFPSVREFLQPVALDDSISENQVNILVDNNYIIGSPYPESTGEPEDWSTFNGYPFYSTSLPQDKILSLYTSVTLSEGESINIPITNGGITEATLTVSDDSSEIETSLSSSSIGYGAEVTLTVTAQEGITEGDYYVTVSPDNGDDVIVGVFTLLQMQN